MSEKIEGILSGMVTTIWIRRTWIKDIMEHCEVNDILPLAPNPPNGNPGAE